jgi:hypothetical protein
MVWELTFCVSVNPILKFIYTLCMCKNKYIYIILSCPIEQCVCVCVCVCVCMILHGNAKQYKYGTM